MKAFLGEDFLLSGKVAKKLYHEYARELPILDYHCHISPREIYEDRSFENITQVWLGADHYKWRLMRANGVDERYITGDASDWEKFEKWAQTLELAIGNPLYHWSHLELRRYFGYTGHLCSATAKEVWELCREKLAGGLTARKLIEKSKVCLLCTTDDPVDSLEWHDKIAEDATFQTTVLPTFRPERAMNPEKADYPDYLNELGKAAGLKVSDFGALIEALKRRMDFFESRGCRVSDHSLDYVMYAPASEEEIEDLFARRLEGGTLSKQEGKKFRTAFMLAMGREYRKRGWVMQLHFGVKRDNNSGLFRNLGADAGGDCILNLAPSAEMADYLNALENAGGLPKTILYSLNPADNAAIGTVIGCFQDSAAAGKLQQGSAWWFNDHKEGMISQMTSLANQGLLGNFIGMLTDSRSFLSYTRHEYFRRILCDLIGGWVEDGEYPEDYEALGKLVKGISFQNAVRYFGFEKYVALGIEERRK